MCVVDEVDNQEKRCLMRLCKSLCPAEGKETQARVSYIDVGCESRVPESQEKDYEKMNSVSGNTCGTVIPFFLDLTYTKYSVPTSRDLNIGY